MPRIDVPPEPWRSFFTIAMARSKPLMMLFPRSVARPRGASLRIFSDTDFLSAFICDYLWPINLSFFRSDPPYKCRFNISGKSAIGFVFDSGIFQLNPSTRTPIRPVMIRSRPCQLNDRICKLNFTGISADECP